MECENNHKLSGEVEIDETFVGGKNKNRHKNKKVEKCQGRSFKDKVPVFGILILGTYYCVSKKHLQLYVDEYIFRFNTRYHSDFQRFDLRLRTIAA